MGVRDAVRLGAGAVLGAAAAQTWAATRQVDAQYRSPVLLLPDVTLAKPLAWLARHTAPRPGAIADGVALTERLVPVDGGEPVQAWVYEPRRTSGEPIPAVLWIHGGGYVLGSPVEYHDQASAIAAELGVRVVSPRYRLAPEQPFPAAFDDCFGVLAWMHASAADEGVDASRIAVGGVSAGGGLAAATVQAAVDRGVPVAFQLLVYPMLDDRTRRRTSEAGRYVWSASSNRYGWSSYLAGGDPERPYAVPARRADLSGLPPAWIGVGDLDLFADEDRAYAERLRDAGVPVELVEVPGAFHGFDRLLTTAAGSRAFAQAMRDALRRGLGVGERDGTE